MKRPNSIILYTWVGLCWVLMAACTGSKPLTPSESALKSAPSQRTARSEAELLANARAIKKAQPQLFEKAAGVLVTKVLPDGQGTAAGLRPGDILLRYGDQPLNSTKQLIRLTGAHKNQARMLLTYLRGQARETVEIRGGKIGVGVRDVEQIPEDTMKAWYQRGEKAEKANQTEKALAAYEQGLTIARRHQLGHWRGVFLVQIDNVYFNQGNYPKALDYQEQSLAIFREIGDRQGEGASLGNIGIVYRNLGNYPKALDYHEQSLAIKREIGDRQGEGASLDNIANVYDSLGNYPKALDYHKQSLAIFREIGNRQGEGVALEGIGIVYRSLGNYPKALDYHEQSLAIFREIGNRQGEGASLGSIGNVYRSLGNYPKALDYYEQSLAINREIGDRQGEGASRNNIGNVYDSLGNYPKALNYYEQSLAIDREIGNRRGEGRSLGNIGLVYYSLGDYLKALDYHEQSLAIFLEIGDRKGEGKSLNNIGLVYDSLGNYPKALDYQQQSLAIKREIGDRRGEGSSLGNIGIVYRSLGNYPKALDYLEQSLAITREIGERDGEGNSLTNIGTVYYKLGKYSKALEHYEHSLVISETVGAPESHWRVWNGLRITLAHLNLPYAAILAGKKAVNVLQNMRATNTQLDRSLQRSFLKDKAVAYQALADLLIDQGRLPEAQQVLAMLKEEEYHDFIRRDAEDDARTTRASLTSPESEWEADYQKIAPRLVSIGRELDRLEKIKRRYRSEAEQSRIKALRADLDVASKVFQKILDDLQTRFANLDKERYAELERRQLDVDLTGMVDELSETIEGEVVLLHTLVLEDHLRLILTTGQVQKAYKVDIRATTLRHDINKLKQQLRVPGTDPKEAAHDLYNLIIGPIEADLQQTDAKLLMVSLDDALRYVPLAALYDGKQWLIERYALSVFTDAAMSNIKDHPNPEWQVGGLGLSQAVIVDDPTAKNGKRGFPALSAVPAELEGIVRSGVDDADGVLDGELHLDQAFTLERLQDVLGEGYPVVHLASHFRFNPGTEKDSYLVLGEGKRLDLAQLRQNHFKFKNVDLLTLSACETAVGGDGREVEGLAVTAQKAGAKGVIATLWRVADQSTGRFMQNLYRLRQEKHLNKAQALRQAQLRFIRGEQRDDSGQPDYTHPYYWAPFILMGNWL